VSRPVADFGEVYSEHYFYVYKYILSLCRNETVFRIPIDTEGLATDIGSNGKLSFQITPGNGNSDISAIYYLDYFNGNFSDLALATDADFMKIAENAVLLWEK
jgi:hypothetical protein